MSTEASIAARAALAQESPRPLYLRLAEALESHAATSPVHLPSARSLSSELGLNRSTVTAAYRELARRGLIDLKPGRPRRRPETHPAVPSGPMDLARYAPDRELLPPGRVFRWLGMGDDGGDGVAQYGSALGTPGLRAWIAARLEQADVHCSKSSVLLTSGLQHGLDLALRALGRPGDTVLVEDPTYPGLPPLLALHALRPVSLPVEPEGVALDACVDLILRVRPKLAVLTPTLHNPSGQVLDENARRAILDVLRACGTRVIEEWFDAAMVCEGDVPPALAALDSAVLSVGSFAKALFPGLRVGWLCGPASLVARIAAVKRAADLSGSPFLEAAALTLCQRGAFDAQVARLKACAATRRDVVLMELSRHGSGLAWSTPRGGFSLVVRLPVGMSSRSVAARAARRGVQVLPGPVMSVSGRDDIVRITYAGLGGEALARAVATFIEATLDEEPADTVV